ncbi:hypothetical protein [Aureibacillus halotolerans]|uniref:Uncharacterized protein n=1 Tax=Aureibacillus halotolerans TaxID=1508390 RepID=A0A4V3D4E2_9BACI|nr:hypothetical protein [Aureibacillus halotolerans]TDQ35268.1 hypothetical protein EV213_12255 [Aureibacillus halotolerans]
MSEEQRLKDIKEVSNKWLGGFIRGDSAMSDISNIMEKDYVTVTNAVITAVEGKPLASIGDATLSFSSRR